VIDIILKDDYYYWESLNTFGNCIAYNKYVLSQCWNSLFAQPQTSVEVEKQKMKLIT